MRIAWYTPYSSVSAIARFSHLVVEELRRKSVEVDVVRSERRCSNMRSLPAVNQQTDYLWAADFPRRVEQKLSSYDLVVYNLGDHYDFHAYSFLHQAHVPGISIVHDYVMHHALYRYCVVEGERAGTYRGHIESELGRSAVEAMDAAIIQYGERHWWDELIVQYPVYRWGMKGTLGAISHANYYESLLRERLGCPTRTIPLAYNLGDASFDAGGSVGCDSLRPDQARLTLLTVGQVNPNKRYQAVIRALSSSSRLANGYSYRIVGPIETPQREQIEQTVKTCGRPVDVTMTGRVDEETLVSELRRADVLSCLRYPALEGASASVIEGLMSGRPVIVTDTGCYREIPGEFCFKVSPDTEVEDLIRTLNQLLDDLPQASRRAADAADWARRQYSSEHYAEALLEFAEEALFDRPVLRVADHLSDYLYRWAISDPVDALSRIDLAMTDLFGSGFVSSEEKVA